MLGSKLLLWRDVIAACSNAFQTATDDARVIGQDMINIVQRNTNAVLGVARRLALAKNPAEALDVQLNFWRSQFGTLRYQAQELQVLTFTLAANRGEFLEIPGFAIDEAFNPGEHSDQRTAL